MFRSLFTTKRILLIVLFLDALIVTVALSLAIALDIPPKTYFGEIDQSGYITYFSFLQLSIAAVLAMKIYKRVRFSPQFDRARLFWLIACIGLFFLALDDIVGLHEQIDLWLHDLFDLAETDLTDLIDDAIVIGYLIIFAFYVAFEWQTIKLFQKAFIFFQLGFILALVMAILDLLSNNTLFISKITEDTELILATQQWLNVIEDSAKIFAEGMFIVGIYKCWQLVNTAEIDGSPS